MSVLRIIDANGNRAREALRVMEEAARFILDDAALTRECKELRHELAGLLAGLDGLTAHRDVGGDVGTAITTPAERIRSSAAEVVLAAGRRLGEALRSIEEYGKTRDASFAAAVEGLRYRGYDLQQRIERAMSRPRPDWRVCVILTEAACRQPWRTVARAVAEAGPDCIQVREKDLDDAGLLQRVREVIDLSAGRSAVIVNDRPDIAQLAGADGVHLGQGDLPCAEVRRLVGDDMLLGVSTSCLEDARRALAGGADYCGIGPMFPTRTKHKDVIAGPDYARAYVAWGGLPHLAIGGIEPGNVDALRAVGVRGIAVCAAVCAAGDPAAVVTDLQRQLTDAPCPM